MLDSKLSESQFLFFFYCKHTKRVLTAHIPTLHTKPTYKTNNAATYANYNTWTTYANYNTWTTYSNYNTWTAYAK